MLFESMRLHAQLWTAGTLAGMSPLGVDRRSLPVREPGADGGGDCRLQPGDRGQRRWGGDPARLPEARRTQTKADREFVASPFTTAKRRDVFAVQVRASRVVGDTRTLFGVLGPQQIIRRALQNRHPEFGVAVRAKGHELYARPASGSDAPTRDRSKTPKIAFPNATAWIIEVWPRSGSPLQSAERGPAIALAGGLLFSALVAAVAHFGTLARRLEQMLRHAPVALAEKIDETHRRHGELFQLSAALEARVAERTTELNETIAELATFKRRDWMDMRFAEKLFRTSVRLHTADGFEGHGVRLAIVERMVRRHCGLVWAQSTLGRGATFYFTVVAPEGG